MYISTLSRNKKSRKSQLFKRKIVETFRAEIATASQIRQALHISQTELRRLNRWYFKHRLKPLISSNFLTSQTMKKKTDLGYLKALEQRLLEVEKENKFLRLKAEAFETAIQIAEEHWAASAVQNSYSKKVWHPTIEKLSRRYPLAGMDQLCKLFGLTRQAWYAAARRQEKRYLQQDLILAEVRRIRRKIPGIGTAKLHEVMQSFIKAHQLKLGRDKLHKILKDNNLLSSLKRKRVRTTDSDHCYYKYPNRAKNLVPDRANALWVSDLTYIPIGANFVYLSVIMDVYSRKIVGWNLNKTMEARGALQALDMALLSREKTDKPLIHHSDRGVQYCSWKYVDRLKKDGVIISMTQSGDPNENAMAERVIRTLKQDFGLRGFVSFSAALDAIAHAISTYNAYRPHASLGYLTPQQAHLRTGFFPLKWYPYKKIRYGNVHYSPNYQRTG